MIGFGYIVVCIRYVVTHKKEKEKRNMVTSPIELIVKR